MTFEFLVAVRYLKARRKQAAISIITIISIIGVAAGVGALVIALAMNAGFREEYQSKLLGAQPHINLMSKKHETLVNYLDIARQAEAIPDVIAASPAAYDTVLIRSAGAKSGAIIKGIVPEMESRMSALSTNIVEGSLDHFEGQSMAIGRELATALGTKVGDRVEVLTAEVDATPVGSVPRRRAFTVAAIYESGLFDLDSKWVYVPLKSAQELLSLEDTVTTVEVKIKDVYAAEVMGKTIVDKIGSELDFTDWIETNRSIFQALKLEKLGTTITIGLIVVVAALNIVVTLIMMVLEKTRDIAILTSMGATTQNIRRIFMYEGLIIGVVGTVIGIVAGQLLSFAADRYQLIPLAPDIYAISFVPFRANPLDSLLIGSMAIVISYLATLYPSAAAARMQPVEALRYE